MEHDQLWDRLLDYLNQWATAREAPRGIEVTWEQSPGVTRTVEVVMSRTDWGAFIGTIYGTDQPVPGIIQRKIRSVPDGVGYLVYDLYDWEPSETREGPPENLPEVGPGEWVVTDSDGKIIDRLADHIEPD